MASIFVIFTSFLLPFSISRRVSPIVISLPYTYNRCLEAVGMPTPSTRPYLGLGCLHPNPPAPPPRTRLASS